MFLSNRFQGLKVIDLQQSDYMRTLESAIQFGLPVLLQNVHENLDPSLDPILNKSIIKVGACFGLNHLINEAFVYNMRNRRFPRSMRSQGKRPGCGSRQACRPRRCFQRITLR